MRPIATSLEMPVRVAVLACSFMLCGAGCGSSDDSSGGNVADPDAAADAQNFDGSHDAASEVKIDGAEDAATLYVGTDGPGPADAVLDDATPDVGDGASFVADYPAQPAVGTVFWGAAINGNGDPVERHEAPSGHALSIRRTFFRWDHRTGYMIDVAQDDVDHGRLPWVSIKPPSWAEMADGVHDDEIDDMLEALDALDGPVWLTVHHEPEGGGGVNEPDDPAGPSGHVAMNRHVRERMTALSVDNVALAPILMTWTWAPASGRNVDDWWDDGIYDFLGVDHYRDEEATLLTDRWYEVRVWAQARGVDLAVGEWGMRGIDAAAGQRVRDWYEDAIGSVSDGQGARVVGLCAFDSGLNSPSGSWELQGDQLTVFRELLGDPRTATVAPP